jgi:chemotaxis signal transduction protein
MQAESGWLDRQILQFQVPGLELVWLAVAFPEVLAVTRLTKVIRVPFVPRQITGIGEFQGRLVTVIDAAAAVTNEQTQPVALISSWQYLVARLVVSDTIEYVAWPVLRGAQPCRVPRFAPQAEIPPCLAPAMIIASILLDRQCVCLLDSQALAGAILMRFDNQVR